MSVDPCSLLDHKWVDLIGLVLDPQDPARRALNLIHICQQVKLVGFIRGRQFRGQLRLPLILGFTFADLLATFFEHYVFVNLQLLHVVCDQGVACRYEIIW